MTNFFVLLSSVKPLVLILSILLSLLSGGKAKEAESVAREPSSDQFADQAVNREICITAVQGYSFAGGESSNTVSVRTTNSFRRTSPQTRSTFRIVKGGKVIDNNHLRIFLTLSFNQLSGEYISERYLYALCRLRL